MPSLMKFASSCSLVFAVAFSLLVVSCEKDDIENRKTLKDLYKEYKSGMISECSHQGETVYVGSINGADTGSEVYDADGNRIGICNYAWGNVDAICSELSDCEVIYAHEDNIWGQPAVDKYDLGK